MIIFLKITMWYLMFSFRKISFQPSNRIQKNSWMVVSKNVNSRVGYIWDTVLKVKNVTLSIIGEIAGIVMSLLLLAFIGGFVCAVLVVRKRQVSIYSHYNAFLLLFCNDEIRDFHTCCLIHRFIHSLTRGRVTTRFIVRIFKFLVIWY